MNQLSFGFRSTLVFTSVVLGSIVLAIAFLTNSLTVLSVIAVLFSTGNAYGAYMSGGVLRVRSHFWIVLFTTLCACAIGIGAGMLLR
jgi:hypothetical protein